MNRYAIDLLYSDFGSFDKDFHDINQNLRTKNLIHKKGNQSNSFYANYSMLSQLPKRSRLFILSGKYWHIFLLLFFFKVECLVIHFIPKKNSWIQLLLIKLISMKTKLWVYSSMVQEELSEKKINVEGVLTSRFIDLTLAKNLAIKKINDEEKTIYIPSPKNGVREELDMDKILMELLVKIKIKKVISHKEINDYTKFKNIEFVTLKKSLSEKEYQNVFVESSYVCFKFNQNYESRASGIVLDSISNGCICLTSPHRITKSYGFPKSCVTDFSKPIQRYTNDFFPEKIAYGNEFINEWQRFFK